MRKGPDGPFSGRVAGSEENSDLLASYDIAL